jgi:hypothetical protein
MTTATSAARIVWGPHRVFCTAPAERDDLCSCGAEYLGDGWWWIPFTGAEGGEPRGMPDGDVSPGQWAVECSGAGADRGRRDA